MSELYKKNGHEDGGCRALIVDENELPGGAKD